MTPEQALSTVRFFADLYVGVYVATWRMWMTA
jgi:hypothetical protein